MAKVYLIKPLEKKSVVWQLEMFRRNDDDTISWFNMNETYRWGQGFIEEDLDCNLPFDDDRVAYAKTDCGWGSELEDSCAIDWEFSDDIDEDEQEFIKNCYYNGDPNDENVPDIGGAAWLFDGTHNWEVEDDYLEIIGPFQVSLCEDDGTVLEANVKLRNRAELKASYIASGSWPFPS